MARLAWQPGLAVAAAPLAPASSDIFPAAPATGGLPTDLKVGEIGVMHEAGGGGTTCTSTRSACTSTNG